MENNKIKKIELCLEDWCYSYPTGVIAYSEDEFVSDAYCESLEEFQEFLEENKELITEDTRLILNANVTDLLAGDSIIEFARKCQQALNVYAR